MAFLPNLNTLGELKGRLLNVTGNAVQKGSSLMFKLGTLMEIVGDSNGTANLPSLGELVDTVQELGAH
nr:uncharacterized protein LOC108060728 [Drosophila takahashii]